MVLNRISKGVLWFKTEEGNLFMRYVTVNEHSPH